MDQVTETSVFRRVTSAWILLWVAAAAGLAIPLILLTMALEDNQIPSQDQTVLDWVSSRDFPLLDGISRVISAVADGPATAGIGIASVGLLWLLGATRAAQGFAVVGAVVLTVSLLGDRTLGEIVGHTAPSGDSSELSFPSGHVFGTVVFYGFWGFLGFYYGLKPKFLIAVLAPIVLIILAVGFSRMFELAHWPSDVAAGYLLGGLWLLVLIPFFIYFQKVSWLSSAKQTVDMTTLGCET